MAVTVSLERALSMALDGGLIENTPNSAPYWKQLKPHNFHLLQYM
jgi:hypothetical protein